MNILLRLKRPVDRLLETVLVLLFFSLFACVIIQVFTRYVLNDPAIFTEEASRFFFMWAVAFAAGPAVREQAYVDVDSLTIHLPQKLQLWLQFPVKNKNPPSPKSRRMPVQQDDTTTVYSSIKPKCSNRWNSRLNRIATSVASTIPCTVMVPKVSLAPERPTIITTAVMVRLRDLL